MTGIVDSSLSDGAAPPPEDAIEAAAKLGCDGLMFQNFLDLSPSLDCERLRELSVLAAEKGISLGAGIGWINPTRPDRERGVAVVGDGDFSRGLARIIAAASEIGISNLFFAIGMIEDRFSRATPWAEQIEAVAKLVRGLGPLLRERSTRLLVKTHEEINSFEIVRLVERVGPELLGVALDPVNIICRIEDPVAATRRLAPYVYQVHVDDALLRLEGQAIRRFLTKLGDGIVAWGSIFALLRGTPRFIELHRGQFAMPVFDREWVSAQPDLVLAEYAALVGAAVSWPADRVHPDQAKPSLRLQAALSFLAYQERQ
jgi:sugar phosphate isomerase/epimerase